MGHDPPQLLVSKFSLPLFLSTSLNVSLSVKCESSRSASSEPSCRYVNLPQPGAVAMAFASESGAISP